jgi:hypothetical protein
MNLLQKLCLLFCCACFLCLLPADASACVCASGDSPCQAAYIADGVFLGRVLQTRVESREVLSNPYDPSSKITVGIPVARLRVNEGFLGVRGGEIEVYGVGDTCDYQFNVGKKYLVYAGFNSERRLWETNTCTRTRPEAEAREDLLYFCAEAKKESGTTVQGKLHRWIYRAGVAAPTDQPIRKAEVIFESAGASYKALSDENGNFKLAGLPKGSYRIHTDPATNDSNARYIVSDTSNDKTEEPRAEWELELSGHGCLSLWFVARPAGEISGYVTTAAGEFPELVNIELISAEKNFTTKDFYREQRVDGQRLFKFTYLPPGRYYLGFNIGSGPSLEYRYQESYFPGVVEREAAAIITIGDDQKVTEIVMPLPEPVAERVIEGVAVWPDGQPAPGISVELKNPGSHYRVGKGVEADAQGRFALKGLEGQSYELSALVLKNGALVNSKPLRVTAGRDNKPVLLIVEEE